MGPKLARRTPFFYGWVILFAAGTSQFVRNAVASLTLAVFVYPMTQELGWSRTLIGGAVSLGGLVASGASPSMGWLVDRLGARVVLSISILAVGLSTISLAWATAPLVFYLGFGVGRVLFLGPIPIGSSVLVSHWFVKRRGRAIGILFASHAAGMTVFPLVASLIIEARGWQMAWLVLGSMVWLIALGPASLLIIQNPEQVGMNPDGFDGFPSKTRETSSQPTPEPVWTLKEAMRTRALWLLVVSGALLFLIQVGVNIHQGAYFRDQGLGPATAGTAITLTAIFAGIGCVAWGWAIERVRVQYAFALVALLMGTGAGLITTADTAGDAFVFACVFGVALGGILVVPSVAYADYFGRRSLGAIRGITETFVALGQAGGAVISGAIFDASGSYHSAFSTYVVLGALTFILILVAKPPSRVFNNKRLQDPGPLSIE